MTDTTTANTDGWRCHICGKLIPYGATHTTHGAFVMDNKIALPIITAPVSELAHEEDAESERLRLQADRDRWYELAMEYLKRLQELERILDVVYGNVGKARRIVKGKEATENT